MRGVKERLRLIQRRLDPLELLHQIRESQSALAKLASNEPSNRRSWKEDRSMSSCLSYRTYGNPERSVQHIERQRNHTGGEPEKTRLNLSGSMSFNGSSKNPTRWPRVCSNACNRNTLDVFQMVNSERSSGAFASGAN